MEITDDQSDDFLKGLKRAVEAFGFEVIPEILPTLCQFSTDGIDMASLTIEFGLFSIIRG
jgi:hypothetical protein